MKKTSGRLEYHTEPITAADGVNTEPITVADGFNREEKSDCFTGTSSTG